MRRRREKIQCIRILDERNKERIPENSDYISRKQHGKRNFYHISSNKTQLTVLPQRRERRGRGREREMGRTRKREGLRSRDKDVFKADV